MDLRAEINEIENRKNNRENQCNQNLAFWKDKIDRPSVRLTKELKLLNQQWEGTLLLTLQK